MARSAISVLGLLLIVAGLAALGLTWLSVETMQSMAGGIRQPADVTPQRVMRFRQVAWVLAGVGVVGGFVVIRARQRAASWGGRFAEEYWIG